LWTAQRGQIHALQPPHAQPPLHRGRRTRITRDRIYGQYEWSGRGFRLVDTGGIVPDDPELIPTEIYNQAKWRSMRRRHGDGGGRAH